MVQPASQTSAVLVFHGSSTRPKNAGVLAFEAAVQQALFPLSVRAAFLEAEAPDIPATLQALKDAGMRRVAVQPVMLTAGQHVGEDIPAFVSEWANQAGIPARLGGALRGGAATHTALAERVGAHIQPHHDRLIILARKTPDKMAEGEAHRLARILGQQHGRDAEAVFWTPRTPLNVPGRPLIAPHVLFEGAVTDTARATGHDVSAPLGAHAALVEDVAARLREMISTLNQESQTP